MHGVSACGGSCFCFHFSHQVSAVAVGTLSQLGHSRITVAGRIQTMGDGAVTARGNYLRQQLELKLLETT